MSGRTATWKQSVHSTFVVIVNDTGAPFDKRPAQCCARSHGLPKSHVRRSAILECVDAGADSSPRLRGHRSPHPRTSYKANGEHDGEWAARDFCCDCFGVPDQETKNELFSRPLSVIAVGSRGMVNVRAICARDQLAIEGGAHDNRSRAAE
jgi:hypothetical protein